MITVWKQAATRSIIFLLCLSIDTIPRCNHKHIGWSLVSEAKSFQECHEHHALRFLKTLCLCLSSPVKLDSIIYLFLCVLNGLTGWGTGWNTNFCLQCWEIPSIWSLFTGVIHVLTKDCGIWCLLLMKPESSRLILLLSKITRDQICFWVHIMALGWPQ